MVNYEDALPYAVPVLVLVALVLFSLTRVVYRAVGASRERTRRILEVYEKNDVVTCEPLVVGYEVRVSRFPMPPPEQRGFFDPSLGEPFEWVADKEDA